VRGPTVSSLGPKIQTVREAHGGPSPDCRVPPGNTHHAAAGHLVAPRLWLIALDPSVSASAQFARGGDDEKLYRLADRVVFGKTCGLGRPFGAAKTPGGAADARVLAIRAEIADCARLDSLTNLGRGHSPALGKGLAALSLPSRLAGENQSLSGRKIVRQPRSFHPARSGGFRS
jgi:hypothetical protein